jgi:beta-galactosidase GanA
MNKISLLLISLVCHCFLQAQQSGIVIKESNGYKLLHINNQPFYILGGELGNSTASDAGHAKFVWPKLRSLGLNTVLVPVYWELIEPTENKFDFTLVEELIRDARKHQLKLVLLWFGTWKNSMSCYAPEWMKTNPKRFPRTLDSAGRSQEILSVFGKETLEADKKAFGRLMKFIREKDAAEKTVIMVQVENEIGMLPTAREISAVANTAYTGKVPAALITYLQQHKNNLVPELTERLNKKGIQANDNWEAIFGKGVLTEEIFQAWHYAAYTNEVTAAGKKEYNLPMFVNAALPRPGKLPGQYPSAGPLPQVMDIWQAAAPALDMLSPDFYNPDTQYWCDLYVRQNNALFIPEIKFDSTCGAKAIFVTGRYKTLGFSPFSIENGSAGNNENLKQAYHILQQVQPVLQSPGIKYINGVLLDKDTSTHILKTGAYTFTIKHDYTLGWNPEAKLPAWPLTAVMIIQLTDNEFIIAGTGAVVTVTSADKQKVTNLAAVDEIKYAGNKIIDKRRLNGDETHQGRHIRIPVDTWNIQQVKLYQTDN